MPAEAYRDLRNVGPAELGRRAAFGPVAEESLLKTVIQDFVLRVQRAPVGTVAFTGLNLLSSLIPSASFLLSDAVIARAVQKYVDPGFRLTYEKDGSLNKENVAKLFSKMLEKGHSGTTYEQAQVRKAIEFMRDQAHLNGHAVNPLKGRAELTKIFKQNEIPLQISETHYQEAARVLSREPAGFRKALHQIRAYGFLKYHERQAHLERVNALRLDDKGGQFKLPTGWAIHGIPTAKAEVRQGIKEKMQRRGFRPLRTERG